MADTLLIAWLAAEIAADADSGLEASRFAGSVQEETYIAQLTTNITKE